MMIGIAIGWVLGVGTAILLFQFAAAALADDLARTFNHPDLEPIEASEAVDVAPMD